MIPLTYSPLIASLGWRQFSWKGRASHWNWNDANVYFFVTLSLVAYLFCFAIRYLVPLYLWFLCHQGILLILLYLNFLEDLQCTWNQHFEQVLLVNWLLKSCKYVCKKNFILEKGIRPRPVGFFLAFHYSGTLAYIWQHENVALLKIWKVFTFSK